MGVAEVETTVAQNTVASKNLKFKVLTKKPLISACEFSKQVNTVNCMDRSASTKVQRTTSAGNKKLNCSILGTKRKYEGAVECQKEKRVKLNRSATLNCVFILGRLMKQDVNHIFHEPVDPIKMGIPDYFDVIKKPMDLGTIRQKLDQNMYSDVEEFESDVKLTFSNAMLYNPPDNWVHKVAKEMMITFGNLWKPVKAKFTRQRESIKQLTPEKSIDETTHYVNRKCERRISSHVDKLGGHTTVSSDKDSEDFKNAFLEKVQRRDVKALEGGKVEGSKSSKICRSDPGSCGPPPRCEVSACGTAQLQISHQKPAKTIVKLKCPKAVVNKVACRESKASEIRNSSASHLSQSDPDSAIKEFSSDDCGKVSEATVNYLDEEQASTTSSAQICSVGATSEGFETVLDIQLSPSKALRAAMLKSRFADTILKAQHKTLLQPVIVNSKSGDRTDQVKLQQEKERLERKQREEKARLEAQIRAAQSAARSKAESELKKQREQERKAARIALEKMERSTDLDDNFHIVRELETMIGSPLILVHQYRDGKSRTTMGQSLDQFESGKLRSPLERLGLFIKAEYMVGDDDDDELLQKDDWEEGEVIF